MCSEMVVCKIELFLKRRVLLMAKKVDPKKAIPQVAGSWVPKYALSTARLSKIQKHTAKYQGGTIEIKHQPKV